MEVTELLNKVIGLIEKDVEAIERLGKYGDKLDHMVAQDLVRYSGALLDLSSTLDAKRKEEKAQLSRMPTEELIKHVQAALKDKA